MIGRVAPLDMLVDDGTDIFDALDELLPTYFTVLGEQREWDGPAESMPTDWKLVCSHIDDRWINRGDRLRGLVSWYLNRVTTEHLNTGRGWEPVRALVFFVRCYPIFYSRQQLVAIALGYERRRRVLRRERPPKEPSAGTARNRARKRRGKRRG